MAPDKTTEQNDAASGTPLHRADGVCDGAASCPPDEPAKDGPLDQELDRALDDSFPASDPDL
jgi:hypothetical protein